MAVVLLTGCLLTAFNLDKCKVL